MAFFISFQYLPLSRISSARIFRQFRRRHLPQNAPDLLRSTKLHSVYPKIVSAVTVVCRKSDFHFLLWLGQYGPAMLVHEKSGLEPAELNSIGPSPINK